MSRRLVEFDRARPRNDGSVPDLSIMLSRPETNSSDSDSVMIANDRSLGSPPDNLNQ